MLPSRSMLGGKLPRPLSEFLMDIRLEAKDYTLVAYGLDIMLCMVIWTWVPKLVLAWLQQRIPYDICP
jgi:hypothetical protein